MQTLLTIVQQFCLRVGVPKPLLVASSLDDRVLQMLALLNEELDYLIQRWHWEGTNIIGSWTTIASETQGKITALAPNDFVSFVPDTFWDQTLRLPVYGPKTAAEWELLKALPTTGPFYQFRINAGRFLMNPVPPAGHTLAFEYKSHSGVLATDGTTYKRYFDDDADTPVLPDFVFGAALKWRWQDAKGLDYSEAFRQYEEMAANAFSIDGLKPNISMSGGPPDMKPGIMVPIGNWLVP